MSQNHINILDDTLTSQPQAKTIPRDENRHEENPVSHVYKWYNWEHGNFRLRARAMSGRVYFYLNFVGEYNFE